ncbi:hypothetical protein ABE504_03505 [Paenibacillus oryzisoli]|uniref:hypothetical protein n=1 Tax=Paenibacillus oryzisoli TaxID=1850517 RepID=UPI003D2C48F7
MAYTRLVVLVMAFEVFVTVVAGLGIYWGFSLFPYSQSLAAATGAAVQAAGFHATIPLYMPSLADLKIPYTYLETRAQSWGTAAIVVSAAVMAVQSFVRGMYLGGLKAWVLNRRTVPLIRCGRQYFSRMLAWSLFQNVTGLLVVFIGVAFIPLGFLFMLALLFYSLTPYLIVLQNISFGDAMAKAPRLFRRYFSTLFPLALLAMLCTLLIGPFHLLTSPWGYAVPLLVYASVGTLLIGAVMRRLALKLTLDGAKVSDEPFREIRARRAINTVSVLLVPVLVFAGIFAASGRHISAFEFGSKERLNGFLYRTNFSDVFYASQMNYTAYDFKTGDYSLDIKLPDLSQKEKPGELRGIAEITWQVNEEIRTVQGNSTRIDVKAIMHKSRLMYRLVRETASNGSYYYSSMRGTASILPGGEKPREPLSVQIMVSGDGKHVFALQYPSRFDITPVFRVSDDGRYLIPATSRVNPSDFHAYWFTAEPNTEDLFDMLAAKNKTNYMPTTNRAYLALASAMQEGDGRMLVKLLETLKKGGVDVKAPEWDELTWTHNLQNKYREANFQQTVELLTKAGVQGGYESKEIVDQSDDKIGVYRFEVPFPDGMLPITYTESKADGKLLSVSIAE